RHDELATRAFARARHLASPRHDPAPIVGANFAANRIDGWLGWFIGRANRLRFGLDPGQHHQRALLWLDPTTRSTTDLFHSGADTGSAGSFVGWFVPVLSAGQNGHRHGRAPRIKVPMRKNRLFGLVLLLLLVLGSLAACQQTNSGP